MEATAIPRVPVALPIDRREVAGRTAPALSETPGAQKTAGTAIASAPPQDHRVSSGFTLDPSARSLVYQVTSTASGDVVFQFPSDEALKARAYRDMVERVRAQRDDAPPAIIRRSL